MITAGHWVDLFLRNTAEGGIVAAALDGGEAKAEGWLPAPRAIRPGVCFRVCISGWRGRDEDGTQTGVSFLGLKKKKKSTTHNNNKTVQPLHSSACRGAFFSSCKMEEEGCENNDRKYLLHVHKLEDA